MPTYSRQCPACQHEFDDFCTVSVRDREVRCEKCDTPTERVWRPGGARKTGIFPYVTTHLTGDGKPIEIESLAHLRRLERQYGVKATAFSDHRSNWDDALPQSRDLPRSH